METLINQGKNYDEIAEELKISKSSIDTLINKFHIKTSIRETKAIAGEITKERLEALIESGKSVAEISEELHIARRYYTGLLNKLGITTKLKRSRENIDSITKEKLQELVDSGLTVDEILKRLKLSQSTFYQLLKRLDIRYDYKNHANEIFVPKHKLQNVVDNWKNKDELIENLGIAEGTFYHKSKVEKVETQLSDSINRIKEIDKKEVQEYLDQGATPQEICELYNITPSVYHTLVQSFGITSSAKKRIH